MHFTLYSVIQKFIQQKETGGPKKRVKNFLYTILFKMILAAI